MNAYVKNRKGFTLVELLVVISLIAILAALTITFFPSVGSSAREARAATQLQAWLNIAKQRALRDQAPRGLRLWLTSTTVNGTTLANVVTDCQYIEQPDDFTGGFVANGLPAPFPPPLPTRYSNQSTLVFSTGVDLVNGYSSVQLPNFLSQPGPNPDANAKFWTVQPGDHIELFGTGLMYQIVQIGVPSAVSTSTPNTSFIVIKPPVPYLFTSPTANYRIVRAPRAVGDETLKLPDNTVIDLNPNFGTVVGAPTLTSLNPNPLPIPNAITEGTGFIDILFAPNGSVISQGISLPFIHLWVRAPLPDQPTNVFRGDPTLVSVFVKTGLVGAFPPDPNTVGNPYTLVK